MRSFYSSLAGVTHTNSDGTDRQEMLELLKGVEHPSLILEHEPDNPYDENAIGVWFEADVEGRSNNIRFQIGYLPTDVSEEIIEDLKDGVAESASATIEEITGGTADKPNYGMNIKVEIY